ncbi:MAG: phosphoenolpyruvate--protein phosphotransferase [Acidimicrobiales bacterium]
MSVALQGAGVSPGVAVGPPFAITPVAPAVVDPGPAGPPAAEKARLRHALAQAAAELHTLADRVRVAAGDEAEIFEAHAGFAEDPELEAQADELIDAGQSAIGATVAAFATFRALLAASTSEYLAARAADLDDVCARVTAILAGVKRGYDLPEQPSVLLARELTPSETAEIPRDRIAAIVTETGSPTSHAAILARTLGIPAVVGAANLLQLAAGVSVIAVDGRTGDVHLDPDADVMALLTKRHASEAARLAELEGARGEPGQTADGVAVELVANVAGRDDLALAVEAGAEGAGLVRTELLFQDRRTEPTVDEQAAYYGEVLGAFGPHHRVVFRTLDIGADKPMPFVTRPAEPNPALGLRGIRLSLRHPKLFENQLRGLVRAHAAGGATGTGARMAIMFPLVSRVEEVTAARDELHRVAQDEGVDVSAIEVGVMIEVPSAALAAGRIAPLVDFFSIGTNDLLQYLFAADRLGAEVAELADICEPVVLDLVGQVVAAANEHGAWVGVCGETASDPSVGAAFVGLGVRELSMVAGAIGEVKDLLSRHDLATLAAAAETARRAPSAALARAALASALG